jgi:hypothetical protein
MAMARKTEKTAKPKNETGKKEKKKKRVIKTPAVEVKEKFGSKENLIKEVKKLFDKTDMFASKLNPDKGVERVSNRKLLRLHQMATEVKEKFGSRKKLVEAYLTMTGKPNVKDAAEKLSVLTLGKLLDLYHQAEKR